MTEKTQPTNAELLPCPFCGTQPDVKLYTAQAAESVPAVDGAAHGVADAMADSQYLAGVSAGWNAANADDPNAALQKLHESRTGYLKPLATARAPADSQPAAALKITAPNDSGSAQCIVRWQIETPKGWIGAWNREALDYLLGLTPKESVPAIQGEMNVQLDIDSNHSAPGQQRDVARSVALGQPMGHGPNQVADHLGAQGDKLLTVAERNIRSFLRSAQFKSESDREAALNCVDVLWAAARDPADSVLEDAARYRWLRDQAHPRL